MDAGTHDSVVREMAALRSRVHELEALNAVRLCAMEQTDGLAAVSHLAIDLAAAPSDADLLALIAASLRDLTNAIAVGISLYDTKAQELVFSRLAPPQPALVRMAEILNRDPLGMRFPLSPEVRAEMLASVVRVEQSLYKTFFGVVPRPIAAALQKAFGIDHFVGLALCYGDELLGSAVLAISHHRQSPPIEALRLFAHLAAVSLRRKRAEDDSQRRSLDLERLHVAGQTLNASLQVDQVLETMVDQIRGLLGVAACSVWLVEPGGHELRCACASGPHKQGVVGWRWPPGRGWPAGWRSTARAC